MQDKDPHKSQQPLSNAPAAAVIPANQFQRAENENPRANENIRDEASPEQPAADTVGSEITDGEDA